MAGVCQGRPSTIVQLFIILSATLLAILPANAESAYGLSERPILIADPGYHTAPIRSAAVDRAGRFAVTGSEDKTVRIWSLADGTLQDGKLLRTIRMPSGPEFVGQVFAVAMSPDAGIIAVGGWTTSTESKESVYLFDQNGNVITRIGDLPDIVNKLVFSSDGRYLAAAVGNRGLRVYDRYAHWSEAFHDADYTNRINGITFATDGRLATASYDSQVRLYEPDFRLGFRLVMPPKVATGGQRPHEIAFSPNGNVLAVGYADSTATVDLLDGHNLEPITRPNTQGLAGILPHVAWSTDGQTLFVGGTRNVFAMADGGQGNRRVLQGGDNTIMNLHALPDGGLLLATADPLLKCFRSNDSIRWAHTNPLVDPETQGGKLAVSKDGMIIDFGLAESGRALLRFDVRSLTLIPNPPLDQITDLPREEGLLIEHWRNEASPTLQGQVIRLDTYEKSRHLAISQDNRNFVLGTSWSLRAFEADGHRLWRHDRGVVLAVNITGDGRLAVAAYNDGVIRWHRMDTGRELLALMVLPDKTNWVAWTPQGYYAAEPKALGVLRWHINHGIDAPGTTISVASIKALNRQDVLRAVLKDLNTDASKLAETLELRKAVQEAAGTKTALPGTRLHVLTIGINSYGDKATNLKLKYADSDAYEIASNLDRTQGGGPFGGVLYAEVKPQNLSDPIADRIRIFEALDAMAKTMDQDDFAVVMFAGHGAMIDKQFYLVPYNVDISTQVRLKDSAIPTSYFQEAIAKLARHGHVMVLLDACHSGGVTADNTKFSPNADVIRRDIFFNSSGNVTVLTSSSAEEVSHENDDWKHGLFSKVFIDALSQADADHNGIISMNELVDYLDKNLRQLTNGAQSLGISTRYRGDVFVAGL